MSIKNIIQYYIWRWGIEVNFRDEKTLLGLGQAQVRLPESAQKAPALTVASYACLLLAATKISTTKTSPTLPLPKWRNHASTSPASTAQLINHLRAELWASAIDLHILRDFLAAPTQANNPSKFISPINSACFYATQ